MSGHNPHSHLSQPSSSWNPLQIPSYIPRQPQVAHMSSNERSLVRSPLTWHTPTPPEALYSVISAKYKNLELNPLLPSFVRGPPPFGSVDLTIQSNSRNNSSATSPRNLASPSPDFTTMHNKQMSHNIIANSLQSSSSVGLGPGVIQTTGSVRDKFSALNGGNNCDLPLTGIGSGGVGLYIRDARQINNDLMKIAATISSLVNEQPVELVNQTAKIYAVPTSPKRLSPPRTSSLLNHSPISPQSTSPAPPSLNVVGVNLELTTNNHISTLPPQKVQISTNTITTSTTTTVAAVENMTFDNSPLLCSAAPSPLNATTSNDDSVESNASKTRRRRKPNRIIRVPNDSDDNLLSANALKGNSEIFQKDVTDGCISGSGYRVVNIVNEGYNVASNRSANLLELSESKYQASVLDTEDTNNFGKIEISNENIQGSTATTKTATVEKFENKRRPSESRNDDSINVVTVAESVDCKWAKPIPMSFISQDTKNKLKSVIVDNAAAITNRIPSINNHHHHGHHHNSNAETEIQKCLRNDHNENNDEDVKKINTVSSSPKNYCVANNSSSNKQHHNKQKGDSDDIETIDKIAAMIASSNENEEEAMDVDDCCANNLAQKKARIIGKSQELEPSSSKLTDLTEILGTPILINAADNKNRNNNNSTITIATTISQESYEKVKEIRFEEVENKLEEMFAGIEDERPCEVLITSTTAPTATFVDTQNLNNPAVELISSQQQQIDNKNATSSLFRRQQKVEDTVNINLPSTSSSLSSLSSTTLQKKSTKLSQDTPQKKRRKLSASSTTSKRLTSNQKAFKQQKATKLQPNNEIITKEKDESTAVAYGSGATSSGSTNEFKYKGPFVQLKLDGSINIVNAPIAEDDTEKQNKAKKIFQSYTNSERTKIRGMHISTLSMKYDADTIDATWMCVFCKKGPHKNGLGDLFGPYIVTANCEDFQLSQKNPLEDEFISKRTKSQMVQKSYNIPVVPATIAKQQQQQQPSTSGSTNTKKKKRGGNITTSTSIVIDSSAVIPQNFSQLNNNNNDGVTEVADIFFGMSKVSETSYEVWLHEDCTVWASGVYAIGSRIIGLETAVWSSTRYKCNICALNGAMICCLQRGCIEKAHISCARTKNWKLIETHFKSFCEKHLSFATTTVKISAQVS